MREESDELTAKLGIPTVRSLAPKDIPLMKAHLAAGWVVIITTSLTEEFGGPGRYYFGLPIAPLIGQRRLDSGHAWLLVGCDPVDGNSQWKCQGRFLALNSWGRRWPLALPLGHGLCSIPFGMLLTEGLEACALRLH